MEIYTAVFYGQLQLHNGNYLLHYCVRNSTKMLLKFMFNLSLSISNLNPTNNCITSIHCTVTPRIRYQGHLLLHHLVNTQHTQHFVSHDHFKVMFRVLFSEIEMCPSQTDQIERSTCLFFPRGHHFLADRHIALGAQRGDGTV